MSTFLDDVIRLVLDEKQHSQAINDCFIYFQALAETRRRGEVSNLFECLPEDWPTHCDDDIALRLHHTITDFIEKCPSHPNVGVAFHTLLYLDVDPNLTNYFINKLKLYYAQGNASAVYYLCQVIEDSGMKVFVDENGKFMQSRSSCDGEINLGVARRFLERLQSDAKQT